MKELIAAGGAVYLMPAVLFALVLYVIRGIYGLHGRRSQQRKEFLELWSDPRSKDDVWLEVAIRHLYGTYLPAHIVRSALARPDKCQSLLDLSELWPLLRYDADTQIVSWRRRWHSTPRKRWITRAVLLASYFALALASVGAGWIASKLGHGAMTGWIYGACAVLLAFLALACLMRDDAVTIAANKGQAWIARINADAVRAQHLEAAADSLVESAR